MRLQKITWTIIAVVLGAGLSIPALASSPGLAAPVKATAERVLSNKPIYSPYADRNFPTRPYFGDTHLHTAYSMDAGAFGARLGPRDAYRFARGEQITSNNLIGALFIIGGVTLMGFGERKLSTQQPLGTTKKRENVAP